MAGGNGGMFEGEIVMPDIKKNKFRGEEGLAQLLWDQIRIGSTDTLHDNRVRRRYGTWEICNIKKKNNYTRKGCLLCMFNSNKATVHNDNNVSINNNISSINNNINNNNNIINNNINSINNNNNNINNSHNLNDINDKMVGER
ncbi:hypothetical protein HELRODRAFT_171618 [Helobdella robusta]|uniref:Uncharacterized protein n=1 Tax=Helobdella robusta TaxID=6412 RepID=T1F4G6_HELRO|nr:hypothetical protein HELRODRAFT_171618 [Helobdella robusta]ESO05257.1 hypothetical protein HELRODRAFT_171618 [Helobdella robusta]